MIESGRILPACRSERVEDLSLFLTTRLKE
jgi:hypothetical protein